jgi:hypothetical protein
MVNGLTNHILKRTGAVKEEDEDGGPIYFLVSAVMPA